jgi:molecular chaperone Hsp33
MTDPDVDIPVREPAQTGLDDTILPFAVKALDLRGRIVRLGAAVDTILTSHDYPPPVAKLLGEAIVLTVMLGSSLKFDGRFILQTQSDGPVRMLVVDFTSPGNVRACARFDAERVAAAIAANAAAPGQLLGHGHLAMTIDQGPEMSRYQGLVPLEGGDLEQAAHEYFSRSEQIPTRVRLAVAEEYRAGNGARRHWRAGGILLQFLPNSPERARQADLHPGDAPPGTAPHVLPEDEAWVEGRSLVATVGDIELIDPALSSEQLAYRRACVPRRAGHRAVLVLARQRREHAQKLPAGRSRRHGRERPDHRDLRVLQLNLCLRAARNRGPERRASFCIKL